ncbi:type IV pilus modification PilV family protein [Planococcus chinensis]|uniref:Prepilin-type N-terminal cleavage/methylation domain-containing protein n=1 Tax=Planococcus chinensis TaxID=272917 RepID=A0ABW4QK94_9BACL
MKSLKNEKGLTLVEVLAALVILGIVFVGIMTIFPQMTLFNAKTEAKLDTMNLAREEMANIVAANKWQKVLVPSAVTPDTGLPDYLSETKMNDEMALVGYNLVSRTATMATYRKETDYRYEADIYLNCETYLNPAVIGTPPAAGMCAKLEPIKLYRTHLKVFKENDISPGTYQLSSETFSFLSYEAVEPIGP